MPLNKPGNVRRT